MHRGSRIAYNFFRNVFLPFGQNLAKMWCADRDGWWSLWTGNWKELPVERLQTRGFRLALLIVNERQIPDYQSTARHISYPWFEADEEQLQSGQCTCDKLTTCLPTFCRRCQREFSKDIVSSLHSKACAFFRRWRWASMWMANHRHCSPERKTRQTMLQCHIHTDIKVNDIFVTWVYELANT